MEEKPVLAVSKFIDLVSSCEGYSFVIKERSLSNPLRKPRLHFEVV
jgi:hypothetical protein